MVDVAEIFRRELGAAQVIARGSERLDDYGRDESLLGVFPPDCAVLCRTREQVAAVLRIARERRIPVTPRGAGSGKVGGCLPVRGGVVLSTEAMDRIIEIDPDDLVAVVEPGVITGELQAAVERENLFYPPDPASLAFCSLGGNVAAGAGGPRAFKYGVTRDYVLGLEVGLIGGELLRAGRRTAKGVTGYDIVGGFVGSEGTFGVITEITLKLLPRPPAAAAILAVFSSMRAAGAAVDRIIHRGHRPRALELADRLAIEHVRRAPDAPGRYRFSADAAAIVLIELDGDPDGVAGAVIRVGELCEQLGAIDVIASRDDADRRDLWQARRSMSSALRHGHRHKVSEDICVPRGAIPKMLSRIDGLAAEFDLPIATYGHAGDGNLHVNLLIDSDPDDPAVAAHIERALRGLFCSALELGGTLTGEHGIGVAKRRFMPLEQSPRLLEWQRRWKRMWDPDELLNPGKVLPARPASCHE